MQGIKKKFIKNVITNDCNYKHGNICMHYIVYGNSEKPTWKDLAKNC